MSLPLPPLLFVDDEKNARIQFPDMVAAMGFDDVSVVTADSAEQALKLLEQGEYFMVVTDVRLGGMSGHDLLRRARARWPDTPVLVITAYATPRQAVDAIKAGAYDYLAKPYEPEALRQAITRSAEVYRLRKENASLRARSGEIYRLEHIIGESPKMVALRQLIQTVAPTNATVLILGESGTGKELVAGALHSLSHRRERNYIRINCAAIPEALLESELFGHEKGSFTGALRQKSGRVEEADGGTIFLDEIGDMSRPLQAKLLRFLEDGTFTRVGGNQELRVDVRLIAATNRDIIRAIRENHFREDLFHRLNVVQFMPPPLRERGQDVLLLAEHFLRHFAAAMSKNIRGISAPAQQKLLAHHWPGNVRELRNAIERAVILETREELQAESLPDSQVENRLRKSGSPPVGEASLDDHLAGYERDLIVNLLEREGFDLNRTAEALRISRTALRTRMQRLNINADDPTAEDGTGSASRKRPAA
ncbi:MAG TPA: sigma-54 dependent transcriptional regulator [Candidatus Paceibacterota bacterium]|nr:sigma-54 dependent transcriptional regulator [Candidatus Paceibacterota bacterium]